jgi:hypothetical protein
MLGEMVSGKDETETIHVLVLMCIVSVLSLIAGISISLVGETTTEDRTI